LVWETEEDDFVIDSEELEDEDFVCEIDELDFVTEIEELLEELDFV